MHWTLKANFSSAIKYGPFLYPPNLFPSGFLILRGGTSSPDRSDSQLAYTESNRVPTKPFSNLAHAFIQSDVFWIHVSRVKHLAQVIDFSLLGPHRIRSDHSPL